MKRELGCKQGFWVGKQGSRVGKQGSRVGKKPQKKFRASRDFSFFYLPQKKRSYPSRNPGDAPACPSGSKKVLEATVLYSAHFHHHESPKTIIVDNDDGTNGLNILIKMMAMIIFESSKCRYHPQFCVIILPPPLSLSYTLSHYPSVTLSLFLPKSSFSQYIYIYIYIYNVYISLYLALDRYINRQTGRQVDRQLDIQIYIQINRRI